jgi:hypothetical protein
MPRFGTFNGSNVITGSTSGATVTPNASVITFANEVVFWKANDLVNGTIYVQRTDITSESAQRFSTLVSAAGCTATIAPGGGGTGNSFPTIAYTAMGTGGSAGHTQWCQASNHGLPRFQVSAANCINDTGVSADGTFWLVMGYPTGGQGGNNGFAYMRMDDTEDGDVDPFFFIANLSTTPTRTSATASGNNTTWNNIAYYFGTTMNWGHAWRRRGYSTNDAYSATWSTAAYVSAKLFNGNFTTLDGLTLAANSPLLFSYTVADRVACHPASLFTRDPIWIVNYTSTTKQRKGTLRWMFWVPTGSVWDAWDNYKWIQIATSASNQFGMIIGPWDGVSSPQVM